jgi:hypothetical protein
MSASLFYKTISSNKTKHYINNSSSNLINLFFLVQGEKEKEKINNKKTI